MRRQERFFFGLLRHGKRISPRTFWARVVIRMKLTLPPFSRVCGHSGFPFCLISDSNFQNGGLNERAAVCGVGHLVAAA